jgi:phytoene desaturase
MMKEAVVIGAGFAGLSAACFMAKAGVAVTVVEKNGTSGGRGRSFSAEGFTWDMGPSWYWMPNVFENFFSHFGKKPSDYYELIRLNPSYEVVWKDEAVAIPASMKELEELFEHYEVGSGKRLQQFMKECGDKYSSAMKQLVYQPGLSITEFMRTDVLSALFKMDLLQSVHKHVRKYFSHPKLLQLVEFPILFLGALPRHTPALYTLMNYADMSLGTWYPMGGMVQISIAMEQLARSLGVDFKYGEEVSTFRTEGDKVIGINTSKRALDADIVIAACDYHHAEALLPAELRNYKEQYWQSQNMAPSSLLYYLGVNKKLARLKHHNLFFDAPFDGHAEALYKEAAWPEEPLMYVCAPSKTDPGVAPEGCENLFILIPIAPGLVDNEQIRAKYLDIALQRIEGRVGEPIRDHIVYQRSYAGSDFTRDYNAYKGNAYGLANTLMQTAVLKPSIRNKKLRNLFYAGQLTVPGPGVPPAIISGEIVAKQALRQTKTKAQSAHI